MVTKIFIKGLNLIDHQVFKRSPLTIFLILSQMQIF